MASQEAEAREAVVRAGWSFGGPNRGPGGRASLTAINKAIDAYAAAIRASERERYARGQHDEPQIKALRGILDAWKAVEDTAHYGGEVREEAERLLRQAIAIARALAALEEAESA